MRGLGRRLDGFADTMGLETLSPKPEGPRDTELRVKDLGIGGQGSWILVTKVYG